MARTRERALGNMLQNPGIQDEDRSEAIYLEEARLDGDSETEAETPRASNETPACLQRDS